MNDTLFLPKMTFETFSSHLGLGAYSFLQMSLSELAESALRASPARSGYPGDYNAVNNIAVEGMA